MAGKLGQRHLHVGVVSRVLLSSVSLLNTEMIIWKSLRLNVHCYYLKDYNKTTLVRHSIYIMSDLITFFISCELLTTFRPCAQHTKGKTGQASVRW